MKILNLYAGIGGNRKLWDEPLKQKFGNDYEITAVEINQEIADIYKDLFPNDNVLITDAHEYLLKHYKEYDFIWSSPPCQSHSAMKRVAIQRQQVKAEYVDLQIWQQIILLKNFSKKNTKWVIENVKPYYQPFVKYSFKLDRHLFWNNFEMTPFKHKNIPKFIDAKYDDLMEWLGFDFKQKVYYGNNHCPAQILRNAVHPDLGLHILNRALEIQTQSDIKEPKLF